LVTDHVGEDRVVADAKLFWPEKGKGKNYLISAFNQAYTYARDYNEPASYLVIYKMSREDSHFLIPSSDTMFRCLGEQYPCFSWSSTSASTARLRANEGS
jgi:hypothetical protein